MNKKGDILVYPFLAGILLGLAFYYITDINKQPAHQTAYIGQMQLGMLKGDLELRKALLYLDSSAELSVKEAIYSLGQNGGADALDTGCGLFGIFSLWNNEGKECYPIINDLFNNYILFSLDKYLKEYSDLAIPEDNYDFYLNQIDNDDLEVVGSALKNIHLQTTNLGIGFTKLHWPTEKEFTTSVVKKFIVEFYDSMISTLLGGDLKYYIGSCYGEREKHCDECSTFNYGVDIPMYELADVYAAADGKVIEVDEDDECGKYIVIDHDGAFQTMYCHIDESSVEVDDEVEEGDDIGKIGETGVTYGTYLNFRVKVNDLYVNPIPFFHHIDYTLNEESLPCQKIGKVSYSTKPSFKVSLDYNMSIYSELKQKSKELIIQCSVSDINDCVQNKLRLPEYSLWFNSDCESKSVVNTDRRIAFCVKQNKQFYIYDETKEETELKYIEIKFALAFKDNKPPLAVENVEAEDAINKENGIIIKWQENIDDDVKYYNIYYSPIQFSSVREFGVNKVLTVDDDDDFDSNGYLAIVENLVGYDHSKEINSYWFAVVAEDFSGNENTTVVPLQGDLVDDLAPASPVLVDVAKDEGNIVFTWEPVTTNTDGTEAFDLNKYKIYYSLYDFNDIALASFFDQNDGFFNTLSKTMAIFTSDTTYYFAATTTDEANNENQFVTPFSYKIPSP